MAGGAKRVARGSKKKKKKKGGARDLVADLTDDVLVDIFSRVPVKSLCLCKSVCRRWRKLICHPDHRKKLPQTLAGFFYMSYDINRFPKLARHFIKVSGAGCALIDPALSFLPKYESIDIVDSCNGLLLFHGLKLTDRVTMDCVVGNPATEKWVVVPDSGWSNKGGFNGNTSFARLGFDPAVSTHFHVLPDDVWHMDDVNPKYFDGSIQVVAIYSSKTGVWSVNEVHYELGCDFAMPNDSKSVFFNGALHLTTSYGMVLAIDVEGNISRYIPVPILDYEFEDDEGAGDVYLSQGHLYFAARYVRDGYELLSVWVLEDYNSENWSLKHNIQPLNLFGAHYYLMFQFDFSVISIHPEHDTIFMVCGKDKRLVSYDMVRMRLSLISRLGCHCRTPYLPYVPLFSGSLA